MSGVPQGTVLTPAFFIIMISEINGKVKEQIVRRFVDDTRISKKIGNRKLFQGFNVARFNIIYEQAKGILMVFNEDKFEQLVNGENGKEIRDK